MFVRAFMGPYVFNDRNTVTAGTADFADCALEVIATVVSRPEADRAVIDAGSKSLTSDAANGRRSGHGYLPDYPDAEIKWMSEEHGMIDLSKCDRRSVLGEKIPIIPNDVCPVVNLHDDLVLFEDGAFCVIA